VVGTLEADFGLVVKTGYKDSAGVSRTLFSFGVGCNGDNADGRTKSVMLASLQILLLSRDVFCVSPSVGVLPNDMPESWWTSLTFIFEPAQPSI
jgi:hypothetical protein